MVIMDSSVLLMLFHPDVPPAQDPATGRPVEKARERIELLVSGLSKARVQIVIPTPVLTELLYVSGPEISRVLSEINGAYAFVIAPFDEKAAIECALLVDGAGPSKKGRAKKKEATTETKAKVKFDQQIIAIAKSNNIRTLYTDDGKLSDRAVLNGLSVVHTWDLPLPPVPPQGELDYPPVDTE